MNISHMIHIRKLIDEYCRPSEKERVLDDFILLLEKIGCDYCEECGKIDETKNLYIDAKKQKVYCRECFDDLQNSGDRVDREWDLILDDSCASRASTFQGHSD